ncbi:adhesin [Photorhabdus sp. RW14-46]|nr:adhesin [Photorhabdus sp. RW14-46]
MQSGLYSSIIGNVDKFGQRITIDMPITGLNGKTAIVRTGWIYDLGSSTPRLTMLYVK